MRYIITELGKCKYCKVDGINRREWRARLTPGLLELGRTLISSLAQTLFGILFDFAHGRLTPPIIGDIISVLQRYR